MIFFQKKDGTFEERSQSSGIKSGLDARTVMCFDYNNDGYLDVFIGHAGIKPTLEARNGSPNKLFRNNRNGTFTDVTEETGMASTGFSLAAVSFDYNADGWADVYVANDFGRDEFFENVEGRYFKEIGDQVGLNDGGAGMNATVIDANGDGYLDVYTTVVDMFSKNVSFKLPKSTDVLNLDDRILHTSFYLSGNKLFVFDPEEKRFYARETDYFEPGDMGWGWSANFFDYENDGDLDMVLANGWIPGRISGDQKNRFYIRDKDRYYHVSVGSDESFEGNSRAIVVADLTGNGSMDLVVSNFKDNPVVLKNMAQSRGHWIKVKLEGPKGNKFGIGASITLQTKGQSQMRMVTCGSNYFSQDETTVTFGMGKRRSAESIIVVWPGHIRQKVAGPFKAGKTVTIAYPENTHE